MAPTGAAHIDFTLAALSAVGGVMGFMRKRSLPSLLGGLGIGAAYAASGYFIDNGEVYLGHNVGAVTSVLLTGIMGLRLVRTRQMVPAGMMATLGLAGAMYHIQKSREWAPTAN